MSSFTDLFQRVQVLTEAKYPAYDKLKKQTGLPGKMKKAGLPASSRDAMLFLTMALSRTDIITPEEHDHTIKGQHTDRMEKIMAILINKEDEINAKSDEIVEFINNNLDNYTSGAGTDRDRTEKYKETAKAMSQEVQNIKAGKEADDALRDIVKKVKKADEDLLDSLGFGAEDDTTIIEIDAGNVANVERIRSTVEEFANELGVEVTGNTVEFSVNAGSDIDKMVQQRGVAGTEAFLRDAFKGKYPVFVSIIPPAGPDEKAKVADDIAGLSKKPEGIEGREHLASVNLAADEWLKGRGLEPTEEDAPKEDAEREDAEYAIDKAVQDILQKWPDQLKDLKDNGVFSGGLGLFQDLFDHYRNSGEMPYGAAGGKDVDPEQWLFNKLDTIGAFDQYEAEDAEREGSESAADGAMKGIKAKERLNYIDNIVFTYEGKGLDWYKKVLFKNPLFKDKKLTPYELKVLNRAMLSSEDNEHKDGSDGKFNDGDGVAETCDYKPCKDDTVEDGEYQSPYDDTEAKLKRAAEEEGFEVNLDIEGGLVDPREVHDLLKDTEGGSPVTDDDIDRLLGGGKSPITESKYTTADYLTDIYSNVKPIVETIVESTTVNENGQTTHTHQYLVEKREEAIEQVYTNQYLTEQKEADSLLVPKDENNQTFKERYQPKTSYQLEELRRYGL